MQHHHDAKFARTKPATARSTLTMVRGRAPAGPASKFGAPLPPPLARARALALLQAKSFAERVEGLAHIDIYGQMKAHPSAVGRYVMATLLPEMRRRGETHFAWVHGVEDAMAFTDETHAHAMAKWRRDIGNVDITRDVGDDEFAHTWTEGGTQHTATMRATLLENVPAPTTPVAFLFGWMFCDGIVVVRVSFEQAPAAVAVQRRRVRR